MKLTKRKYMLLAILLLALIAAGAVYIISAAGSQGETTAEQPLEADSEELPSAGFSMTDPVQPGARIAVVSKSVKGEFWKLVKKGMKDAVTDANEAYGFSGDDRISMTFEGPDSELNVENQINTLDAIVAENPSVICLCAGDMDSCQAQLEAARENGIPVVAFDSNLSDTSLVSCYCGTDNLAAGRLAGEKMAEAVGEIGKIAVFSLQGKTKALAERVQGFSEVLDQYPGLSIVSEICSDEVEDITQVMEEVLLIPGLAGVYCTNADIMDIYLKASKPERFSAVVIGTDATTNQQKAITGGEELGCVSQDPYMMGYETMTMAISLTAEEQTDAPEDLLLEACWIDAGNIDDPVNERYIY